VTLTAIVVALVAAVGITGGKRAMVERPLIAPGLDAVDVTGIEIMHDGAPPIVIAIDDKGVRVEAPAPGPADEAVVRDLLSAVFTARADRVVRGKVAALASPTLRVRIVRRGQPAIEIARGAAVPASGQTWLGVDDRAVLVPAWVGAAIDRDLPSLRIRQVFPPVTISGVEIHGRGISLVLAGQPLLRRDEGTGVRVAREMVARLDAALGAIVLDVLVAGDTSNTDFTVRVLGGAAPHELSVHGPCPGTPDHVLVSGSAGIGCVRASLVDAIVSSAAALASPSGIEQSLVIGDGADIESITDGKTTLARRGAGWRLTLDGETVDADDDQVRAFLDALATPGVPGPVPTTPFTVDWTVTFTSGTTETWHWFAHAVRRNDEPNALQVGEDTTAAFRSFGVKLRNLTLLVIDASTIASIEATGSNPAIVKRGALVGEWIVEIPAGQRATGDVQRIVEMLATFRGQRWIMTNELGLIRRTLTFVLDAPPIAGQPAETHTIAIDGGRPGNRCGARVDRLLPIELDATQCAALLAPLAR
jgi:hypothetical protein